MPRIVPIAPRKALPLFGILILWASLVLAQGGGPAADRWSGEIHAALRAQGNAVVFVNLKLGGGYSSPHECKEAIGVACREVEARLAGLVAPGSARVRARFDWIPSLVLEVRDAASLDALARFDEVESIHLDVRGHGALIESSVYLHAGEAHALGFEGEGTIAAVLDSGVDTDHPSLSDAVIHRYHFLDQGSDSGPEGAEDGHGHGTNVTGIIASRGGAAPLGIAPKAKIVAVKVLDDDNSGWLSDWALGVNHVIGLKNDQGISADVINMSLVSNRTYSSECDDQIPAFASACRAAWENGIAVFAASGNDSQQGFMTIPACYSAVVSVGSVRDTFPDRISTFTNRNDLLDILAPGERIVSTGRGGGTSSFMGTSQACPHAAAAGCLLREVDASIRPEAIREVLRKSGRPFLDAGTSLTFPILDVEAAVEALLVPPVAGLSCGFADGTLIVSWDSGSVVDHFRVSLSREGAVVSEGDVAGGETSFEKALSAPGEYTICLRAIDAAGLMGLEECCTAAVVLDAAFLRGDCAADGELDISDPVRLLVALFSTGLAPNCFEACDSNNDDKLDISDAVYSLNYLFGGGPAPAEPFPACGKDPVGLTLGCARPRCG